MASSSVACMTHMQLPRTCVVVPVVGRDDIVCRSVEFGDGVGVVGSGVIVVDGVGLVVVVAVATLHVAAVGVDDSLVVRVIVEETIAGDIVVIVADGAAAVC